MVVGSLWYALHGGPIFPPSSGQIALGQPQGIISGICCCVCPYTSRRRIGKERRRCLFVLTEPDARLILLPLAMK